MRTMAFVFRRVLQNVVTLTTKSRLINTTINSRAYQKTTSILRGNAVRLKIGAVSGIALGGAILLCKDHDFQPILDRAKSVFVVKAEDNPCGAKSKRPKLAAPCKKKKKCCDPQPNVVSCMKKYTLYLWITLEPDADPCAVAHAAARVDEAICATQGFDCDVDDEILAGVGFGPNFLSQNCLSPCKNFCYRTRKGKRGEMPGSNGDIFVHAKADSLGQLFDFCKTYLHQFPDDSVCEFEDLYGFSFRGNRDISGFAINQTNRCREEGLMEVAVECKTGGSYALAQKWIHDLCALDEDPAVLETYVGRKMDNREELESKSLTSHVTRMTGSQEKGAQPQQEIVQQAMSFGSLSERAGYFFLGFSKDPCVFDWMLDRMVGANCDDSEHDDIMRISKNVKGTIFYFPGYKEMCAMRGVAT